MMSVGIVYWRIPVLKMLVLPIFKKLHGNFFSEWVYLTNSVMSLQKTYTTSLMSINQVIDIAGPLSLGDTIFMKFHLKFWFLQDKQTLMLWEKLEMSLKAGFFKNGKKLIPCMCYFWVYMMHHSCLYDSAKTAYPRPIRLQEFLNFNITKTI